MNARDPLTPASPASAVRTLNAPLDFARPYPEIIDNAPPVTCVLSPLVTTTRPPADDFPLPTITLILPPAPSVAEPVRSVIIPLGPPVTTLPVVKDRPPDTPAVPPSAVRILNTPLDVALPYPVIIDTAPPVFAVASPALIATRPPAEIAPLPTWTLTLPAVPSVAEPVRNVI